jgi:hypothetical protein
MISTCYRNLILSGICLAVTLALTGAGCTTASPQTVPVQMAEPTALPLFAIIAFGVLAFLASSAGKEKFLRTGRDSPSNYQGSQNENARTFDTANQWMQCARDEAARAETAASRAYVGSQDMRMAAAYEAQCHADSARNWADRASQIAYNADSPSQDAAARARDAAYQAQSAADRARYNANTGSY